MPFKDAEEKKKYDREYSARRRQAERERDQRIYGITGEERIPESTPKPNYPEHLPFSYPNRSFTPQTGFGEDKKGMQVICSVCGTPLNKDYHCPNGCQ